MRNFPAGKPCDVLFTEFSDLYSETCPALTAPPIPNS